MVPFKNVGQENEVVPYVTQIAKWHFSMVSGDLRTGDLRTRRFEDSGDLRTRRFEDEDI